MKYSIVGFDSETAEITVFVDSYPLITIRLPVDEEGKVPEGKDLDAYINGFLPHTHFQRIEQVKKGIANLDVIKSLVSQEYVVQPEENILTTTTAYKITNAQRLTEAIAERDRRLSACDWTQLDDVVALHSEEWVNEWREYRQKLRDITEHIVEVMLTNVEGVPYILWPVPPA